ncbi:MAG: hypothetical protein ACYCY4_10865 [Thiobacillus sp.]
MAPWNVERIVFIGCLRNLEVVGVAQGRGNVRRVLTKEWQALEASALTRASRRSSGWCAPATNTTDASARASAPGLNWKWYWLGRRRALQDSRSVGSGRLARGM